MKFNIEYLGSFREVFEVRDVSSLVCVGYFWPEEQTLVGEHQTFSPADDAFGVCMLVIYNGSRHSPAGRVDYVDDYAFALNVGVSGFAVVPVRMCAVSWASLAPSLLDRKSTPLNSSHNSI